MSRIKFNYLTMETELQGSESFIESNFNKIQDLLGESLEPKGVMITGKQTQEPLSNARMAEPQGGSERDGLALVPKPSSPESTPARPPMRKYIRKVGRPGHERIVVEVAVQKPRELSPASLREKFALPEAKIEGVIRDAEKLGKIKRIMNGSYVLSEN